jgi:hypothetical protein
MPTLRGAVTDPVGDSLRVAGVSISPDLVSATIEVSGANLTATVMFAPGTLSHPDTFVNVLLNTDENQATGHTTFGWDYAITGVNPRGSTTARIVQALGSAVPRLSTLVGTATLTFTGGRSSSDHRTAGSSRQRRRASELQNGESAVGGWSRSRLRSVGRGARRRIS